MHYYNIHTHRESQSPSVTSILNVIPGQAVPESFFSAGIHPWYAKDALVADLHDFATSPKCLAIGECGLDSVKSSLSVDDQKLLLRAHLELATQHHRPVILHVVRSTNELFQMVKDFPDIVYIWHGFTGNEDICKQFLPFNMYFSCGQRGLKKPESWLSMPEGRLLCETDDSDIPIEQIYAELAAIRNESVEQLSKIIENNVFRIFGHELE